MSYDKPLTVFLRKMGRSGKLIRADTSLADDIRRACREIEVHLVNGTLLEIQGNLLILTGK
jgi:hypothetical protein